MECNWIGIPLKKRFGRVMFRTKFVNNLNTNTYCLFRYFRRDRILRKLPVIPVSAG